MATTGFIIGFIALVVGVMALPTIFQMIFGRPKLTFEADEFTGSDGKILLIAIQNQPVTNRLLRLMGVERDEGEITAFVDVHEDGTKRIIARSMSGALNCPVMRVEGLRVKTLPGFTCGLTIIGIKNGSASIVDGRHGPRPLEQGHYVAIATIIRGQKTYKVGQKFVIGDADHTTYWYSRDVTKLPA